MLQKTREANTRLALDRLPAVNRRYHRRQMPTERFRPSVTVAAVVERDGRYLLVEEHTPEGLRLNNPAGHLDAHESLLQGVMRETLEETACHFEASALVGVYLARLQRPAAGAPPGLTRPAGALPGAGVGSLRQTAGEDVSYLRFAFCGTVGEPEPGRRLDHGIVRTLWLTAQELQANAARHRSPLVWRCIADHMAGRRYPLDLVTTDASVYATALRR
jgi:8-oxo-dGTP pyrophosphatase MutT (NUDIX family)